MVVAIGPQGSSVLSTAKRGVFHRVGLAERPSSVRTGRRSLGLGVQSVEQAHGWRGDNIGRIDLYVVVLHGLSFCV